MSYIILASLIMCSIIYFGLQWVLTRLFITSNAGQQHDRNYIKFLITYELIFVWATTFNLLIAMYRHYAGLDPSGIYGGAVAGQTILAVIILINLWKR